MLHAVPGPAPTARQQPPRGALFLGQHLLVSAATSLLFSSLPPGPGRSGSRRCPSHPGRAQCPPLCLPAPSGSEKPPARDAPHKFCCVPSTGQSIGRAAPALLPYFSHYSMRTHRGQAPGNLAWTHCPPSFGLLPDQCPLDLFSSSSRLLFTFLKQNSTMVGQIQPAALLRFTAVIPPIGGT